MNAPGPKEPRPLLPLVLLHCAAGCICFGFFAALPIVGCLILAALGGDMGGPMFFPMIVLGAMLFAAVMTAMIAGAAAISDLLRRRYRIPIWVPPLVVFGLVAAAWLIFCRFANPKLAPIAAGIVTVAFIVHWAAVSTVWFLPRWLFRFFGIQETPPKE